VRADQLAQVLVVADDVDVEIVAALFGDGRNDIVRFEAGLAEDRQPASRTMSRIRRSCGAKSSGAGGRLAL
jgi:hypothetical protein